MEPLYRESRPIMPRNLTYLVAAVLLATLAFMALSESLTGAGMPVWMIAASAVVFIIIIVALLVLRLDLVIYGDRVWNLKGVKHRSYTRIGDECGIAMKVTGKRVVVVSTQDPEAAAGAVPGGREE